MKNIESWPVVLIFLAGIRSSLSPPALSRSRLPPIPSTISNLISSVKCDDDDDDSLLVEVDDVEPDDDDIEEENE